MPLLDRIFGKSGAIAGYATALVAVAEAEGALARVEEELFAFAKATDLNPQLREALTDPALPVDNRQALVRDILGERAHPVTINLISFVIESGRARDLSKIADAFVQIAATSRERAVAEVRSAVPLTRQAARAAREGALHGDGSRGRGKGDRGSIGGRRRDRARR